MGGGIGEALWKKGGPERTHQALEHADLHALEDLPRLVRVADVLERLGRIFARSIEQDLLTTAVCPR